MRFGIIGCGVISATHGNAIAATPGATIAAACDILPAALSKFAATYSVPKTFSDYHEMLAQKDIDAICVCTPSGLHGEMAIAAAKAGKHLIVEKPIEITKAKLDALLLEIKKSGVKMASIFQRRMSPAAAQIKKAIEDGTFGRMVLADATMKYYRSPEYYKSADWRATWEMDGGGALMNQGVHGIDMVQWLMGGVKRVTARCATLARDIKVEDTAVAILEFKNGALGVLQGATTVHPAQETKIEVHGDKGSACLTENSITRWEIMGEKDKSAQFAAGLKAGGSADPTAISYAGHAAIVADLMGAVKENRDPFITGEAGRKAVDIILAIYESSKTGRPVDVA